MFRKTTLESELIIYRRLMESYEQSEKVVVDCDPLIRSTTMTTFVVERQGLSSIGIGKCYFENVSSQLLFSC
jgi:hypothetical protein